MSRFGEHYSLATKSHYFHIFHMSDTVMRGSGGGGGRGLGSTPVSLQYWSGSPEKSQRYQASFQCWAIVGMPAKRHFAGVSMMALLLVVFGSSLPSSKKRKKRKEKCCQSSTPSDKTLWIRARTVVYRHQVGWDIKQLFHACM